MKAVIFLLAFCYSLMSFAENSRFQGMVEIAPGRSLYVDWIKATPGKETVVLLNGLTYDTTSWDAFVTQFAPTGYGILRYDPAGMGNTLQNDGAVNGPILIQNQAVDLNLLTQKMGFTGKLNILGLSYGGALAIVFAQYFPERINKAILMSPYTEPLASQDSMIKQQIAQVRLMFPLNPASDEELYAYFLRQIVYFEDPIAEPSMLKSPLKPEAVFQMTQGLRKYNVLGASQNFPAKSVNLVIGAQDQYIPRETLYKFWNQLPVGTQASRILIDFSEHKIPEAFPVFSARWVADIMEDKSGTDDGASYEANPLTGQITALMQSLCIKKTY